MTRPVEAAATLMVLLLSLLAGGPAGAVVLAGQVRATDAEVVYAPMSETNPVTLRYLAPEGATMQPGDTLVRIDPGGALAQQETLKSQIVQARARIAKELAELAVRELDAELALVDAEASLGKGAVDASIPPDYIARIDADRFQGEFVRAQREHALKQQELQAARDAVARRRKDGELEIGKLQADLEYAAAVIAMSEQHAEGTGVVIYHFNAWTGQRYEEGLSVNAGTAIGELIRPGALSVRAHALEPDRRGLAVGQTVELRFDAIPERTLQGRITAIGSTPQAKAEWGNGRYFVIDLDLPAEHGLPLQPGMSVRVAAQPVAATETAP